MRVRNLVIVFLILAVAFPVMAGTLSWNAPTTYVPEPPATVGDPIPSEKISQIIYRTFYGNSPTGPWTAGPTTLGGEVSATVPDPAAGSTRWYTVEAFLDNVASAKAAAVSKTVPFRATNPPGGLQVN